jgi:hypothetical protein
MQALPRRGVSSGTFEAPKKQACDVRAVVIVARVIKKNEDPRPEKSKN